MKKERVIYVRITEDQYKILGAKANSAGFIKLADYVRFKIFMPMNVDDMIKEIYEKVVKDGD